MANFCLFLSFLVYSASAYTRLSYAEIESKINLLQKTCSALMNVTTAQMYGVPSPSDCDGCQHYILEFVAAPDGSPHVFFSGALHGDERLGPVTTIALAEYLCESFPTNPWVRHLVSTRRIILMPMPNPQGYFLNRREERINGETIDPNRDFGYFVRPNECMITTTARAIYEILKRRIVVLSVTFHGGTRAVGYPWGAPNHMTGQLSSEAPDRAAADSIGKSCIDYSSISTRLGPMTDTVYEVSGGMEDWAYAASWEGSPVTNCHTSNFTIEGYNSWSFRQLMYLVEMDNDKNPPSERLGEDGDIFSEDGLIPSYLRFSLAAITMVKPYVEAYIIPLSENEMKVFWRVRGCASVDETFLLVGELSAWDLLSSEKYVTAENLQGFEKYGESLIGSCSLSEEYTFHQTVTLNESSIVLVAAKVDQAWKSQTHPDPALPPQTHIVRMRTQDDYFVRSEEFTLVGNATSYSKPLLYNVTALMDYVNSRLVATLVDENYQPRGVLTIEGYSRMRYVYIGLELTTPDQASIGIGEFGDIRNPEAQTWGHVSPLSRFSCKGVPDVAYFPTPYELTFDLCVQNPLTLFIGRSAIVTTRNEKLFGVFETTEAEQGLAGEFSNEGICFLSGAMGMLLLDSGRETEQTELSGYFYSEMAEGSYIVEIDFAKFNVTVVNNQGSAMIVERLSVPRNMKKLFGRKVLLKREGQVLSTCIIGVMNTGRSEPSLTHPHGEGRKLHRTAFLISGSVAVCFVAILAVICYCNGCKRNYKRFNEHGLAQGIPNI